MDKWKMLKDSIKHKNENKELDWVLKEMERIENKESCFLFTDVPTFDQKTWERILEEKGLQGLS